MSSDCKVCASYYYFRTRGSSSYDCSKFKCKKQCKGNEGKCQCDCKCCEKKREAEREKLAASQSLPGPHSPPDSSSLESESVSRAQSSDLPTVQPYTGVHDTENSTTFTPDPQAIAAVIVAIIVAIILLDLCIFRFPVGRNIRDFLVRKIPFCIAFYS
ncbi:hypothetical protein, conserved [Babesia bigemina]|uniref:Uncharacterized protein n=1 Tax=Babesia bigemina TaxID=5866 RepID=A0A061BLT6_BABBI|nr:hypothetical protein, conserved [Babesia bigemina]CDR71836.1 hypothetical protein, conserved [Babesia bigemina]|eukprot:XP_012770779.1 hypothetical protein, conserved [Babesia bigemina]